MRHYTNYALDQLLAHLKKGGIRQLIRISSPPMLGALAENNLRTVSTKMTRTETE